MNQAKSGGEVSVDLFGRPVEALRERRGRPSYKKTEENQRFVEVRAAAGWSQDAIAADMGIDADTLRKHFSAELKAGAIKVEGVILDVLLSRARQGHVPSARELLERIKAGAGAGRTAQPPREKPAREVQLGKKELAAREAQHATDDWADLLGQKPPRAN